MLRTDFGDTLGEFGLPYAFWEFDVEDRQPELPFMAYYDIEPTVFYADNQAYYFSNKYVVELYTEVKDDKLIAELEAFFNAHEWGFIHEPEYFTDERMFREYYEITT